MNIVVLQGTLSGNPSVRTLASGSVVVALDLTMAVGDAKLSVPVVWFDPPSEVTWVVGDALVVVGSVRRRFFRSLGATQSRTEVVADQVLAASRRRQVRTALARVAAECNPAAA